MFDEIEMTYDAISGRLLDMEYLYKKLIKRIKMLKLIKKELQDTSATLSILVSEQETIRLYYSTLLQTANGLKDENGENIITRLVSDDRFNYKNKG